MPRNLLQAEVGLSLLQGRYTLRLRITNKLSDEAKNKKSRTLEVHKVGAVNERDEGADLS